MSDVLTYSDFWFMSLIPIVLQGISVFYLSKIARLIGRKMTMIYSLKSAVLLALYAMILVILIEDNFIPGEQPAETLGFFVGFAVPIALSTLFFITLRSLKCALLPPLSTATKAVKRDSVRDLKRDSKRDFQRDLIRDIPRDISRDINRDKDRDIEHDKDNNN